MSTEEEKILKFSRLAAQDEDLKRIKELVDRGEAPLEDYLHFLYMETLNLMMEDDPNFFDDFDDEEDDGTEVQDDNH